MFLLKFTAKTGIAVEYEGSPEFEVQILVQAEAGTPPDIAGLPQPGLMKSLAEKGHLKTMWPEIIAQIDRNYSPAWKELATYNGEVYGIYHRVNAKSFVYYNKQEFTSRGYSIPKTWDELIALSDQMKADGIAPWSIGMESGAATGWVGTDWMEDVMLRTAGADVYDKWISHDIPFNDPSVLNAMQYVKQIFFTPGYVLGGASTMPALNFGDSIRPLFQNPPTAMLHRQGNFIFNWLPDNVKANIDQYVGVFPLPPIDPNAASPPIMGGGEQYVVFNDTPEVRKVMEFLASWDSGRTWASRGGALFPYKDQDYSAYATDIERELAKALVEASAFRFDASDLMPPEVGNGTFWTGMVEWVTGKDDRAVLNDIEASWP
ncbi:osmoprotective compounds-binding protein GgtB-like [Ylistrum balloti]|uniref:osmoprotective compounds-binding protein GgtB-like n=1 Tax=Ylistrum balloti TaxID=509963 RepID=UPI0029057DC0|nr:osmoprotective compounds-binding protein GgtB-like [Ylistrum balloti]